MFFKIECWNFQHLFEKENFVKSHKISIHSDNFYIQFFYLLSDWVEILWNSFSNICWKFQHSILKKSFISKKNITLNRPRELQQMTFAVPIFSEGFGETHWDNWDPCPHILLYYFFDYSWCGKLSFEHNRISERFAKDNLDQ